MQERLKVICTKLQTVGLVLVILCEIRFVNFCVHCVPLSLRVHSQASFTCYSSRILGGVLPFVGRENLQDSKRAGREKDEADAGGWSTDRDLHRSTDTAAGARSTAAATKYVCCQKCFAGKRVEGKDAFPQEEEEEKCFRSQCIKQPLFVAHIFPRLHFAKKKKSDHLFRHV